MNWKAVSLAAGAVILTSPAFAAGHRWDGADELAVNPLACDGGAGTVAAKPYDGGQPTGAPDLAGQQIDSSVNNPSEAIGFYESGDVIPLVAFTDERLAIFPDVPTLKEKGADFAYYMQRSVVGAPGMSDEALAYYNGLFQKVFETDQWQNYRNKRALLGEKIEGDDLRDYWSAQRDRHEEILKASGAIN